MGLLKRAGDLVYVFRFLRLLTTAFEETDAFKLGLIDKDGKLLKKPTTDEEKDVYTPFIRLVFNIKKTMAKLPGGGSKIATYAAALYLIKEKYSISDKQLEEAINKAGYSTLDLIAEQSEWFMLEGNQLAPGVYKVRNSKVLNVSCEEIVLPNDKVKIAEEAFPVGDVFGIRIYEATHVPTNQKVYVSSGELYR